jgi:hypothetical protein
LPVVQATFESAKYSTTIERAILAKRFFMIFSPFVLKVFFADRSSQNVKSFTFDCTLLLCSSVQITQKIISVIVLFGYLLLRAFGVNLRAYSRLSK